MSTRRIDRDVVNGPENDKEAPQAVSRAITVSDVKSDSFTISWQKATDNFTDSKLIKYKVYYADYDDKDDDWHLATQQRDIDTYTFMGLKQSTKYIFYVEALDQVGNVLTYPQDDGCMMQETVEQLISRPTENTVTRPQTSNTVTRPQSSNTVTRPTNSNTLTEEETAEVLDESRRKSIREYLNLLKQNESLDSINLTARQPAADNYILLSKFQALELQNKEYSIGKTQSDFMPIDMDDIYPGRIVFANSDMVKGKPSDAIDKSLGAGKVTVSINFMGGNGDSLTEHNVDATKEGIKGAISRILQRAFNSGSLPPADVDSDTVTSNSKEKISVDAGCSVDYLGANCKVDITTTKNQETFYQVEYFKQGFYTVSVSPEGYDPVNYFGKKVTSSYLSGITKERRRNVFYPLAVITSVTYGRLGYNTKTFEAWSFNLKADESGGYKKVFTATSKQDILQSSASAHHYARVWGGSASTAGSAIAAGIGTESGGKDEDRRIDAAFTKEMAKNMEVGFKNQGVPISYKVAFLASDKPIAAFLTGKYVESEYVPLVNRLHLKLKNDAYVLSGTYCVKIYVLYDYIKLDANGRKVDEGFRQWTYEWNSKSTKETTIDLGDYCFIKDNEVKIVLYRRRTAINDYAKSSEGFMNVAGGNLNIKIVGSCNDEVRPGGDMSAGYAQYK